MINAKHRDLFLWVDKAGLVKECSDIVLKPCSCCGQLKDLDSFADKTTRKGTKTKASSCRSCANEKINAKRRTEEGRARVKKYNDQKSAYRKATLGYAGASAEQKRQERLRAKARKLGVSVDELPKILEQKRKQREEETISQLCEQNARQAWSYWLKTLAPSWWIDAYYADKPWVKPGLTSTEIFRLRYKLDPEFHIKQRIRAHVRRQKKKDKIGDLMRLALNRNGTSQKVEELLGYTIKELKEHLEKQFTKGMTWEKFRAGEIHIDHIIPISAFDIKDVGDSEWVACWKLNNLRPLWAKENIRKHNKIEFLI